MGSAVCSCNSNQDQQEESFYQKRESISIAQSQTSHPMFVSLGNNKSYVEKITDKMEITKSHLNHKNICLSLKQENLYKKQKQTSRYSSIINEKSFAMLCKIQFLYRLYLMRKQRNNKEHSSKKNYHSTTKTQSNDENIVYFRTSALANGQSNNSRFGVKLWKDGAKYVGEFRRGNDAPSFSKVDTQTSGTEESFVHKAHGYGIFSHSEGDEYKGEFLNDETNGYGIYNHLNGAAYEGLWNQDTQSGVGIEYWADGSSFEGLYSNGSKEGIGMYNWADGSEYIGEWKNNNLDGLGVYKFADGRIYSGEWQENSMHGYGEFEWQDGKKYKGFYEFDQKSGFGIYLWTSPIRIYIGFWKNGKQGGVGRYLCNKSSNWGVWEGGEKTIKLECKDEAYTLLSNEERRFFSLMELDLSAIFEILNY